MSPTGRSPSTRKERISRRRGSATALKASEVVAALAMNRKIFLYGNMSSRDLQRWRLFVTNSRGRTGRGKRGSDWPSRYGAYENVCESSEAGVTIRHHEKACSSCLRSFGVCCVVDGCADEHGAE